MKELPNRVRARLAGPGLTSPGGSAPGAARPHPDANLLSAFAERSLTAAERSRVLEHLALCAECRAEVQLALRATVDAREAEAAPAGRREPARTVSGWRSVLRWDALAAALAALAAVVIFQFAIRSGIHSTSRLPASSSIARNVEPKAAPVLEARNEAATASKPAPAEPAYRALQRTESQLKGTAKAAKSAPGYGPPRAPGGVVAEQAGLPIVASAPPPPAPSDAAKARDVLGQSSAPAPMAIAVAKSAGADSSNAPQPLPPAAPAASQQRAALAESKVARQAAPARAQGVMGGLAGAASFIAAPGPTVRWTIGPVPPAGGEQPGEVERSLDGGRTWQGVAIDGNVRFRAVFAIGDQVWAGGSGGAVYHSSDSGGHWTRVRLGSAGAEFSGDVTSIRFTDSENGRIVTSDGSGWMTSDGGEHWQRTP